MSEIYDIVIVGAGPGGLAAGLYTARAKLKAVVLEKELPGGQINKTGIIEDYPGFSSIDARELSQKMADHAKEFGAEIRMTDGTAVRKKGDHFEVETSEGKLLAKVVILASGGSPIYLGVKGEKEYWTKGVSYCAVCDGPLPIFRNKPMVVVGGGDAALEEGMYLTKHASKIFSVHRRERIPRRARFLSTGPVKANPKMEMVSLIPLWKKSAGPILWNGPKSATSKRTRSARIPVSGVFIYVGFKPRTAASSKIH